MKYSKFNVLFDYEDKSYITNTVTKAVVELDDIHREIINEGSISKLTEEERQILVNLEYENAVAIYICTIPR